MKVHTTSASQFVFTSSAAFAYAELTEKQRVRIMKMFRQLTRENQRKQNAASKD